MLIDIFSKLPLSSVVLLGLGTENRQFLEWAIKVMGWSPKIFILADQMEVSLEKLEQMRFFDEELGFDKSQIFFGTKYLDSLDLTGVQYVIKAPGIWSNSSELTKFRILHGKDSVISSLAFFIEYYRDQIIGVTGTKGKTTTAGLTAHLLNQIPNFNAHYCGNSTNISPYKFWTTTTQTIKDKEYFVLELSSFQLQDLGNSSLSPALALITNYFVDHLDQHSTKQEYWQSKNQIFLHQHTPRLLVSDQLPLEVKAQSSLVITKELTTKINSNLKSTLIGEHNQTNLALAVAGVADVLQISVSLLVEQFYEEIQHGLDTFKNLPYRLQLTREIVHSFALAGNQKTLHLRFINDGAATEPEAVSAAIQACTMKKNEYVWVQFTGKDKGGDKSIVIENLLSAQKRNQLYRVDYCGEVGQHILQQTYHQMSVPIDVELEKFKSSVISSFTSSKQIVEQFEIWLNDTLQNLLSIEATKMVENITSSDNYTLNILLSPCGSSFDEFNNYIQRSEFWDNLVQKIKPLE
jgi:UDP-N-acetylmuramoylalanine-D-glutamate ligase